MRRIARGALVAGMLVLGGCASSAFDRHFEARRWSDAAAAFAADSTLHGHQRTLYRAALMHATPGSEVHDRARARALLDRLVAIGRSHAGAGDPAVVALHALLAELERGEAAAAARERTLRDELDAVTAEADRLRNDVRWLEARLAEAEQETAHLRLALRRLASDLRDRETQLAGIRDELARLKAIDLQRSPSRTQ